MQYADSGNVDELDDDAVTEILGWVSLERRLHGLSAEERLRGVPAEDRVHGLSPEELAAALSPEDAARLRELLERQQSR